MAIGFVYMLRNEAMPGLFKVGCTDRSPSERARQLSTATGVPKPFEVMCYAEFPDAQRIEQAIHKRAECFRAVSNREFFTNALALGALILQHPDRLTEHEAWVMQESALNAGFDHVWRMPDPWADLTPFQAGFSRS